MEIAESKIFSENDLPKRKKGYKKRYLRRKYIAYKSERVYALYYHSNNTLYYNTRFKGNTELIIFK